MEASPPLPLDLLLQIFARSDPVTLVRCAATCKLLWSHAADPAFRGRVRSADRFLIGLLYEYPHDRRVKIRTPPRFIPAKSPSASPPISVTSFVSSNADLFDSYDLVASRDGLLVLRQWQSTSDLLCVCHPVTGHFSFLPSATIYGNMYVLLRAEDDRHADLSFQLIVVDGLLRTQTLSSKAGAWGVITSTAVPPVVPYTRRVQPFPVVLGGVAYWLYQQPATRFYYIVSLDVVTGEARSIEVPQDCHRWRLAVGGYKELLLASSVDGKLGLLVAESFTISIWTQPEDPAGRWARCVVIERETILRSVEPTLPPIACQSVALEWFGERSGSVVFQMLGVGLLLLNLRTKQIHQLGTSSKLVTFEACPYECDLVSLLPAMTIL